ncbi:hypothetical protein [Brachybacterium sp. J153]|uniref:hypothetical protein n=1 Tax=Brachybacterium sp. J153 TaxID=3116488 RepID=UPI002E778E5A|nr:hypothetical protein [Brachybacterium sp. J153]MEE1618744.1 hypothetical protein [Brachybacterium sp. J153]
MSTAPGAPEVTSAGTTAATRPAKPAPSADGPAPETPTERAIAPLSSLTSLLGGDIAGGQACAADGTCD